MCKHSYLFFIQTTQWFWLCNFNLSGWSFVAWFYMHGKWCMIAYMLIVVLWCTIFSYTWSIFCYFKLILFSFNVFSIFNFYVFFTFSLTAILINKTSDGLSSPHGSRLYQFHHLSTKNFFMSPSSACWGLYKLLFNHCNTVHSMWDYIMEVVKKYKNNWKKN